MLEPGSQDQCQRVKLARRDGWCPFNETPTTQNPELLRAIYRATKALDPARTVIDTNGYVHVVTDVYDIHHYEQDVAKFAKEVDPIREGKPFLNRNEQGEFSLPYRGQPYFVSEFGGIWWNPDVRPGEFSWGYGDRPRRIEEFYQRFDGLCNVLLDNPHMFGYCYTQLTDVFQEQNGIFRFDRSLKFDLARLKGIQQRPAAIEG